MSYKESDANSSSYSADVLNVVIGTAYRANVATAALDEAPNKISSSAGLNDELAANARSYKSLWGKFSAIIAAGYLLTACNTNILGENNPTVGPQRTIDPTSTQLVSLPDIDRIINPTARQAAKETTVSLLSTAKSAVNPTEIIQAYNGLKDKIENREFGEVLTPTRTQVPTITPVEDLPPIKPTDTATLKQTSTPTSTPIPRPTSTITYSISETGTPTSVPTEVVAAEPKEESTPTLVPTQIPVFLCVINNDVEIRGRDLQPVYANITLLSEAVLRYVGDNPLDPGYVNAEFYSEDNNGENSSKIHFDGTPLERPYNLRFSLRVNDVYEDQYKDGKCDD